MCNDCDTQNTLYTFEDSVSNTNESTNGMEQQIKLLHF